MKFISRITIPRVYRLLDASNELGTKEGTSAESVELAWDDEALDIDVVARVIEDEDETGTDSIKVDRDECDDVEDDDVDEGCRGIWDLWDVNFFCVAWPDENNQRGGRSRDPWSQVWKDDLISITYHMTGGRRDSRAGRSPRRRFFVWKARRKKNNFGGGSNSPEFCFNVFKSWLPCKTAKKRRVK